MKVYGKNVFNELREDIKSIKKVYIANNFSDKDIISFIKNNGISHTFVDIKKMDSMVDGRHQGIIIEINEYDYVN
jgi:tRNA G18 (ribose-2'-O)-methylase SpoU